MYLSIKEVKPLKNFNLLLTFENNEVRKFDMSKQLDFGVFRELKNYQLFKQVKVGFETVEWPNGADLDPELLYEESQKVI